MSDVNVMTMETFEIAAARWGADVSIWPAEARASGEALLASSPEARRLSEELAAMEADLSFARDDPSPVSEALMSRVLADAASVAAARAPAGATTDEPHRGGLLSIFGGLSPIWRAAGACAASALVGVMVGYMSPAPIAEAATSLAALELIAEPEFESVEMSFEIAFIDMEPF
ncbi:MAG: hypothetical protein AAFP78_14945 [Pseudomonadota bacterium]